MEVICAGWGRTGTRSLKFALEILKVVKNKPISFEVFSDDINEMEQQAMEIFSWGTNVNVKIPITNTKGLSTVGLIKKLSSRKVE